MNSQINRICIVGTVYALFLYLLSASKKEIEQTFFFYGSGIKKDMLQNFPNTHYFPLRKYTWEKLLLRIYLRLFARFKWKDIKTATIFAQDHPTFASPIIGKREYTYIEDGPKNIPDTYNMPLIKKHIAKTGGIKGKIFKILFGNVFLNPLGANNQCKKMILTNNYETYKEIILIDIKQEWEKADESKKKIILSVFNISYDDTIFTQKRTVILFTNPFSADKIITEKEQIEIYKNILKKYDEKDIVIKSHPRDNIDYKKYFENIEFFSKPVPMQLLDCMGLKFEKAITISSSSVLSIPYPIEIEWIGNECHPNLLTKYGNIKINQFK
jgi:hypothetical protein